jgi:hypothetical protein
LLPHLDQRLHLSRAGETVVNQAAVALRFFVETPHRWKTKVRQTVAKLLEMLRAQHLRISPVRSPSHDPLWYQLRRLFAIRTVMTRYEKESKIWFQIWFHPCPFLPQIAHLDGREVAETKELLRLTVNQ